MTKENNQLRPLLLTEGMDTFTVRQIIDEAQRVFGFHYTTYSSAGKTLDNRIRKRIERALRGRQSIRPSKRKTQYSRQDVYWLFNVGLRDFFVSISKEKNDEDYAEYSKLQRKHDDAKKAKAQSDNMIAEQEAIKDGMKAAESYTEDFIRYENERTLGIIDSDAEFQLELKRRKKEILFDYLFDSLIDLDIDALRNDWLNQPDPNDPFPEPISAVAANRLANNRNYYKGKADMKTVIVDALKEALNHEN